MPTAAHQPKKPAWLATLIAALMAGVFLIDLATPLGVADGIVYLVPVLLTSWLRHRRVGLFAHERWARRRKPKMKCR